eukprot:scaffold210391_cov32-Tisochrysis_lutea.AAC.3
MRAAQDVDGAVGRPSKPPPASDGLPVHEASHTPSSSRHQATPSSSTTGWAIGTRSATRAASCPTSASSSLSAWAFLPTQLPHRRRPRSASRSR